MKDCKKAYERYKNHVIIKSHSKENKIIAIRPAFSRTFAKSFLEKKPLRQTLRGFVVCHG